MRGKLFEKSLPLKLSFQKLLWLCESTARFADFVCKLKQTERNEVILEEKRASPYKGRAVEVFLSNP